LSILWIKNKKSLTDGSITLMKMRPTVSIDIIGIDPSLIVPSCACNLADSVLQRKNMDKEGNRR
jgi:hypothetical protein